MMPAPAVAPRYGRAFAIGSITVASMGFHAPQEAARILAHAIDLARQGQLAVRDPRAED